MATSRTINAAGLALVKSFEGCDLAAYQDSVGVWTIGYGHTGSDVHPGLTITQNEAEYLLGHDMGSAAARVEAFQPALNDNQFAAVTSLVFNVGPGAIIGTQFGRDLLAKNWTDAAARFTEFDHAGGNVLPGLLRRREAEKTLFEKPV
jgi:lysozyme